MLDRPNPTPLAVVPDDEIVDDYAVETVREVEPPARSPIWSALGTGVLAILQAALVVAVLFGAYTIANRMIATKPEARKRPAFQTTYTVETTTAVRADNRPTFISYGTTVAARTVELRALVAGEIVSVSPDLRAGARVAKGDALLTIDDFSYVGALTEAEANLAEAVGRIAENEAQIAAESAKEELLREQLELAKADVERAASLRQRGTGTQQQLEARRLVVSQRQQALDAMDAAIAVQQARVAQFEAGRDRLEWRVSQAKRDLASTTLIAPFDGIVRESSAEIGRNVSANDVLVSLYEADTLEVRFTLSDAQYGRLQASGGGLIGREVDVTWTVGGRGYDYRASIDRLGADITSNRGGVEVFARLAEGEPVAVSLRPGAFVEVTVPDQAFVNTIAVPDTAIYDGNVAYVEVDGALVKRTVDVVAYDAERAIVGSGLEAGDEVLTTRITEVSEGLAVRREGDPLPERGERGGDGAPNAQAAASGRATPEELEKIRTANGMTTEQFEALTRPERRKLVEEFRARAQPEPVDAAPAGSDEG
ncbi:efflux RND transporter periplasmic adaptor subunit [Rhizobiaceae bacterium]|nr:efflux RND transporter periplasmic adaptor subunit [Rhizobiaceae bacterium]